jgi:hypothetical protein
MLSLRLSISQYTTSDLFVGYLDVWRSLDDIAPCKMLLLSPIVDKRWLAVVYCNDSTPSPIFP